MDKELTKEEQEQINLYFDQPDKPNIELYKEKPVYLAPEIKLIAESLGSGEEKVLNKEDKALRYDLGKNRLELIPPILLEEVGKILTFGAKKYADHNWKLGMKWSRCIGSLKRHLLQFEKGEDFDKESLQLHLSHIIVNAMFLLEYMKLHPELDDRDCVIRPKPRIGCDLDDCIISWIKPWCEKFGHNTPTDWYFSYNTHEHFKSMSGEELNNFYSNLPAKINPIDIPFDIDCYITARSIPEEITKSWIEAHGFPTKPVYTVGFGQSKVQVAKDAKIDWFIDDNYKTYLELNQAGVCCFLMSADHNRKYTDVGYKRIESFKDLKDRFLS